MFLYLLLQSVQQEKIYDATENLLYLVLPKQFYNLTFLQYETRLNDLFGKTNQRIVAEHHV